MTGATDDNQMVDVDESGAKSVIGAQTLERGLDLLERAAHDPMSIAELMKQSGMNRGVVYRLVAVLIARNYLTHAGDGRLQGGSKLLQLGHSTAAYTDIVTIAKPHLDALAQQTGLSAFLARREENYSVHLLRSPGAERIAVTTQPGTRRLLPETGLGKTLMSEDDAAACVKLFNMVEQRYRQPDLAAQLAHVRETGVLLQIGSAPDLINSVCAPIRGSTGRIVGAINVAAAAQYLDDAMMQMIYPRVAETAGIISAELGS